MEFRQLKTFRTVAGLNSFNQAAKVLNYAQSTVSDQIRALEDDLDVRLFLRSGKHVKLTDAGERLLQYAQRLLDIEEELKTEVRSAEEHHGALSVRIPETVSSYYLPDVLRHFHHQFPKIRCSFNNCTSISLQQEFQSGITNLAFLITDEDFGARNLETEILMSVRLLLVAHPQHALCQKQHVQIEDLKNQTIILPQWDCSYGNLLRRGLTEKKIDPNHIFDFNCLEAIKKCVMTGLGLALISEISARQEIQEGRLVSLPWSGEPLKANLLMIWQKDKWISPPLSAFMEMVRMHIDLLDQQDFC
ncbi:LysR family transcriptional regulator [bacterium]|nr:LysR family transcriptional regulator [bacterium]